MRALPVLLCLIASPAFSEVDYDPAQFAVEQGVFCDVPSVGEMEAPGTVAGKIELFETIPEFQWQTNVVPAVPDVSFGIKTESLDGAAYPGVVLTLTHPPFTETGTTRQAYVTSLGGTGTSINAYTFDVPEEQVPGLWTFRAEQNGEVLYEARFRVVTAAEAPEIAAMCEGIPLS
ncbi:protein of unknown function [Roseivivax halotolerans]|jgi:hypothetical protein|uniref:DUF3859 domain-containing protein n=1 Tax=Roseivivax halotolerans TaxID=93684 RepID=A0A1I5YS33_9RHOB|nr:DUF3859 domain-containing protein [Roseivivax halotolerans]SFQ46920.1 protein of unknown function [Roseivivax halotolerans]